MKHGRIVVVATVLGLLGVALRISELPGRFRLRGARLGDGDDSRRTAAAGVPAELRRVLPGLAAVPADWCEYTPETITVSPLPGFSAPFHAARISREGGVTTWVGRNSLPGASLVAIGKRDRWDAVLCMIGGTYDIHVRGTAVQVIEHNTPLVCPGEYHSPSAAAQTREALIHTDAGILPAAVPVTGDPTIHTSGTTIYTVEVAFYYTQDTEEVATPLAGSLAEVPDYLDSTFRAYLETNNLILEQSKVPNLRWHYAGAYRVPNYTLQVYGPDGEGGTLYNMTYDISVFDDAATEVGAFVRDNDVAVHADQSVLIVGNTRQFGGLATFAGFRSVVALTAGNLGVAHEMGHNYGLYHDRETDAFALHDGDGVYACGYLFHYNPGRYGLPDYDAKAGDIMSYGQENPFYSNPNVSIQAKDFVGWMPIEDPTWYPLGVEADQPRAAYAARALWEGAAAMAAHRTDATQTFPAIAAQPISSLSLGTGAQLRLVVSASGTNLTYQWRKNGAAIAGATSETYTKENVTTGDAGTYDVMVTNALGTVITRAAAVDVSAEPLAVRLVNISTRSQVGTGNDVQIAGFVITGNAPKIVLIRAGSAVLAGAGLSNLLVDPMLELHNRTSTIATNDDWSADAAQAAAIRSAAVQVGAQAWTDGTYDAAILTTLNPGLYSALVKGKNNATGMAIVEVYEVSQVGSRVVNISTRSQVGTGNDVQIAGFVITGNAPKTVLIRAGSAVLTQAGLTGVLADPTLELHNRTSTIATNDDWSADAVQADAIRSAAVQVGAAAWADGTRDAAILTTLNPGLYSALVKGKNDTTGMAIVEVYEVSQ